MKIHMNVYLLRLDQIPYNCRHCVFFFILNTTCAFLQRLYDHGRDCFRDIHIVACMSHVVWDMKHSCTLSSLQLRPLLTIFVALGFLEDSVFSKLICKRCLIVMWMGTMHAGTYVFKSRRLCRMERRSGSKLIPMANQSMNQSWAS